MQNTRYTIKFTNGYWKVFDSLDYSDVKLHYLQSEAIAHVNYLNK